MYIVFSGDRKSRTIALGRKLKIRFPNLISTQLWDGYPSRIFIKKGKKKRYE